MGARFWRLWWATALSSSGDGLVAVALPLLAFTVTRNPVAIAGVLVVQRAAGALVALPAGVLIDRLPRRSVMIAANLVSGLLMAAVVGAMTLGLDDLPMIYAVAAGLIVCDVVYTLALQASFRDVVPSPGLLSTANARLMGIDQTGEQFAGPAVAGIMFSWVRRLPFLADAASFFVSALLVAGSVPRPASRWRHAVGAASGHDGSSAEPEMRSANGEPRHARGFTADFRTGLRVFLQERPLKLLGASMAALSLNNGMVFALLVLYGRVDLHLSATGYGVFIAVGSVLGIVGSFAGGRLERRFGPAGVIVLGSLFVIASDLSMAVATVALVALAVFAFQDFGVCIANVGSVTSRQRLIPRQLFGRVGSVHRTLVISALPIGALLAGFIASAFSVRVALAVAGVIQAVLWIYLAPALLRALRPAKESVQLVD